MRMSLVWLKMGSPLFNRWQRRLISLHDEGRKAYERLIVGLMQGGVVENGSRR